MLRRRRLEPRDERDVSELVAPILPRGTAAAALGSMGLTGRSVPVVACYFFAGSRHLFQLPPIRRARVSACPAFAMGADDPPPNAEAEAAEDAAVPPPPASNRLGNCQVCDAGVPAKYRCPACSTATCSLACSKRHKSAGEGCTGKRDRTAFKDIRDFTDADVVSDYRFLEEALLEKDRAKRWRPEFAAGSDAAARADRAPAAAKTIALLTQQARARGVELFCMPDGMARRVANTTFYDRRRDRMQWRVEWLFHAGARDPDPSAAASATTTTRIVARAEDAKLDENIALGDALRAHLVSGQAAPRVCTSFASRRRVETRRAVWIGGVSPRRGNPQTTGGFIDCEPRRRFERTSRGNDWWNFPRCTSRCCRRTRGLFRRWKRRRVTRRGSPDWKTARSARRAKIPTPGELRRWSILNARGN